MRKRYEDNDSDDFKDVLQQQLFSNTNYTVVDQMKRIAESLERQKSLKKLNQERFRQLQKKVSSLQSLNNKSGFELGKVQRKLNRLQQSQNYSAFMVHLQIRNSIEKQKQLHHRRKQCFSQRQDVKSQLAISHSIYSKRQRQRIKRIKDEQLQWHQSYLKQMKKSTQQVKKRKQQIKQGQIKLKQRLKRYEEYKIRKAQQNYHNKIQKQLEEQKKKEYRLFELKRQVEKEAQIFRKTQILDNQTSRIESIYMTGVRQ